MPSRLPAVTQPVTTAPARAASHDTTALLRGATASAYAETVREVADDVADRLASVTQPFSVGVEAFRMLRTSLVWCEQGDDMKTLVVTSADALLLQSIHPRSARSMCASSKNKEPA